MSTQWTPAVAKSMRGASGSCGLLGLQGRLHQQDNGAENQSAAQHNGPERRAGVAHVAAPHVKVQGQMDAHGTGRDQQDRKNGVIFSHKQKLLCQKKLERRKVWPAGAPERHRSRLTEEFMAGRFTAFYWLPSSSSYSSYCCCKNSFSCAWSMLVVCIPRLSRVWAKLSLSTPARSFSLR